VKRNGEYARKYVTSLQYSSRLRCGHQTDASSRSNGPALRRVEDLSLYDACTCRSAGQDAPHEMQELVLHAYRRFYPCAAS